MPRTKKMQTPLPDADDARIDTMITEATSHIQTRPAKALETLSHLLPLVREDDNLRRHRIMMFMGVCHETLSEFPLAWKLYEPALEAFRAGGHRGEEGMILFNMGILYHRTGRFTDALPVLAQAVEISRELGPMKKMANRLAILARCYMELGRFGEAVESMAEALRCAKEMGDEMMVANARSRVSAIYYELHELVGDTTFPWEDLEYVEGAGDILEARSLAVKAEQERQQERYDESLASLEESLNISRTIGSRYGEALALTMMGETFWKMKALEPAMDYCNAALAIIAQIGDIDESPALLQTIASICHARGDREGAIEALLRGIAIAEQGGNRRIQPNLHRQLSEIYEEMGDMERAFHHYRCYTTIRNSMVDHASKRAIEQVRSKLQVERAEKERQIALMKSERSEQEVEHRIRELAAMALSLKERNDLLDRLRERITAEMRNGSRENAPLLRELLMEISLHENNTPSYRERTDRIEELQERFNRTLLNRFPKLTPSELKICSLMRGSLSTKEIADLLNVTTRNVETHRYHIRKKMNLPKDANLTTFLAAL